MSALTLRTRRHPTLNGPSDHMGLNGSHLSRAYSLLETCKVNGVDGYQYLRSLLVALPRARTVDDYEALLPWRLAR